jgi:ferric-dicitrate binding protein FerR (iron transport regulator)
VCNLVFKRHTLIRSKIKALIDKYLDNRATPGEADLLHHWLDILGEEAMPGKAADAGSREQLRRKMLKVIRQRAGRPAGIYPIWKKMAAAAGILLVCGICGWWINSYRQSRQIVWLELKTAIGEKKMVLLPDSSRIWLGANGILRYPDHFTDSRNVQLLSGEAFFDIAPVAGKPFTVNADSLQVRVLGTSFHIRAYPRQLMEIAVSSGKVSVSKDSRETEVLTANQALLVNRNGYTFSRMLIDAPDTDGWKQDKIVFDNMPVAEALLLLENYYPVTFHIQRPLKKQITGSLNMHLTIAQVINVLEDLTDHQLKIKPTGAGNYTVDQ